jgi:hypothetical protein
MSRLLQRVASVVGSALERFDAGLRAWETAGLALLLLALVLAAAILLER